MERVLPGCDGKVRMSGELISCAKVVSGEGERRTRGPVMDSLGLEPMPPPDTIRSRNSLIVLTA